MIKRRKRHYKQTLTQEQCEILASINRMPDSFNKQNQVHIDLLNRNLILQHGPERELIFMLNPIVKEFIEERESGEDDYE